MAIYGGLSKSQLAGKYTIFGGVNKIVFVLPNLRQKACNINFFHKSQNYGRIIVKTWVCKGIICGLA